MLKNQTHRTNVPVDCVQSYFKRAIFIPYLDSLVSSLNECFSEKNEVTYSLFQLSPKYFQTFDENQYKCLIGKITEKYDCFLQHFSVKSMIWYSGIILL